MVPPRSPERPSVLLAHDLPAPDPALLAGVEPDARVALRDPGAAKAELGRGARPDLVLVDLASPAAEADALRMIRAVGSEVRVLVLLRGRAAGSPGALVRAGAAGCVLADDLPPELLRTLVRLSAPR